MLIVIACMIGGVLAGIILRRIPNITFLKKVPMLFIFLLLSTLGISVGANDRIMNNLSSIGLQALIITAGAVLGSVLLSAIVYKKCFKKGVE